MKLENILIVLSSFLFSKGTVRRLCNKKAKEKEESVLERPEERFMLGVFVTIGHAISTAVFMFLTAVGTYEIAGFIGDRNVGNKVIMAIIMASSLFLSSCIFYWTTTRKWCQKKCFDYFDHFAIVVNRVTFAKHNFFRKLWQFNRMTEIDVTTMLNGWIETKVSCALASGDDAATDEHKELANAYFSAGKALLITKEQKIGEFYKRERKEQS